jgi:hypothetical protein
MRDVSRTSLFDEGGHGESGLGGGDSVVLFFFVWQEAFSLCVATPL